jgi:hypothetical protein
MLLLKIFSKKKIGYLTNFVVLLETNLVYDIFIII